LAPKLVDSRMACREDPPY